MISQTQVRTPHRPTTNSTRSELIFVMSSYTVGGAEKQLALLLGARPDLVGALGVKVVTFHPARSSHVADLFARLGVKNEVVERSGRSFLEFLWHLVNTFRKDRPTIVHTLLHSSTGTWGRLAARLAGVPYVFHSDLSLDATVTRTQQLTRPFLDRLTTRFLPNADAIAERLVASGVPRRKIMVVSNGVDLSRFSPRGISGRARWGIPEGATVAGYLGMFRPEKRPELLLDAVLRLPPSDRPDYLAFAGDGPLMPMMRSRVEGDPWLRAHCRLLGVVEDTPAFLDDIDYLILCSDTEGLPNAVLEAMAMEKPVVATRVSDVPELIRDVGFLAEPGQATSLGRAIAQMQHLSQPQRREMGRMARARVIEHYDIGRAAERFWAAHLEFLPQAVEATP